MSGGLNVMSVIQLTIGEFLKEKLLPTLVNILESPIVDLPDTLLLYHLLIAIIILICIIFIIKNISFTSEKKSKPKFITYYDLKWRYTINPKGKILVEETPYCKDHNVKMLQTHVVGTPSYPVFHCPVCEVKFPENEMEHTFDLLHQSVKHILESKK